jgi:peptide subunit release factor RF-3
MQSLSLLFEIRDDRMNGEYSVQAFYASMRRICVWQVAKDIKEASREGVSHESKGQAGKESNKIG